jgi:hypothetical protein
MIIDAQLHAYETNTPQRPWHVCGVGVVTFENLSQLGSLV